MNQPTRRSILSRTRPWVLAALGVLLMVVAAGLYLQTRHGFRHVIVPVAQLFLPGELEVRNGVLRLPGTLDLEGVRYVDREAGLYLEAERFFAAVSLPSFVGDRVPVIYELDLRHARVDLSTVRDEEAAPEPGDAVDAAGAVALVPLAVQRGRVDGMRISLRTPDETVTVDNVALTLDGPGPDASGHLGVNATWRVLRTGVRDAWSGTADLALALQQGRAGATLEWSGSNRLVLHQAPGLPTEAPAVLVTQALEGRYAHATRALHATSSAHARQNDASIAAATLEIGTDVRGERPVTTVSLSVDELTAAALNLALGAETPARFETGRVTGRFDLGAFGERVDLRSSITGEQLRLRLNDSTRTTPPIAAAVQQAATFDRRAGALTIHDLEITVSDHARSLVVTRLNRPLHLSLEPVDSRGEVPGARADPAELSITVNEVGMDDVRPWLALTGHDGLAGVRDGVLQGRLLITVRDQAETIEVEGDVQASRLVIRGAHSEERLGPLLVEQELRARLVQLETLHLDTVEARISMGTKAVGNFRAAGSARVHPRPEVRTLNARLSLDGFPGAALNPLLAQRGGTRVAGAVLSGTSQVQATERRIVWDADLRGEQVSFRRAGAAEPTPPLDVTLVQGGRFDRDTSVLILQGMKIQVLEGRRAVLAGTLDQPLTLALRPPDAEAGAPPSAPAQPIRMTLALDRLGVGQLGPWLALTGSRALEPVQAGALEGRLQIEVRGHGDMIAIDGHLDAAGLRIRGADVRVPLTLRTRVDATIAQATRVTLNTMVARLLAGSKELAQVQLVGSADRASGAMDVTVNALSGNVTSALDRLGWLSDRQRRMVADGELDAELRIATKGTTQPLAIAGRVETRDVRALIAEEKTLTQTLAAQVALETNGARTELQVRRLDVTMEPEGGSAGTLAVTGHWPLPDAERTDGQPGRPARSGELVVTAGEFDIGPLVDMLDLLPGRAPGRVPVSIDATVTRNPTTQILRVRGRETLGPLRVGGRANAGMPTTIHLEHDLSHRDDEIRVAVFELTSNRPEGLGDRVHVAGDLRLGARPRVQLHGAVDVLDAGWYEDLLQDPEARAAPASGPEAGGSSDAKRHTGPRAVPFGLPLDLDVEIAIGAVRYHTFAVGKGRLSAKGTGERADVTLEPTGLAGGTVYGAVTAAVEAGVPRLAWSVGGKGLDLGAILQAADPARQPAVTGRATFTTSGKGRGQGEALEQNLSGTAVLDITDGRFVESELLAVIAKHTGIEQFESFGFQNAHADFRLEDGWIHATSAEVTGPGVALGATGKIGLDGRLDASVVPKVAGDLARHAKRLCVSPLLTTVGDLTVFPIAVTVKGTIEHPSYGVKLTVADALRKGVGGLPANVLETLKECANLPKVGRQLAEGALDVLQGAAGILEGLFTNPRKKEGNEK